MFLNTLMKDALGAHALSEIFRYSFDPKAQTFLFRGQNNK